MILRVAFFMLMAVGLLGFGTVAWISTRPPPAAAAVGEAPPPTTKTVLTAAHAVHAGVLLKPEDLASRAVPINDPAADDSNADTPDARRGLVGAMVRRSLSPDDIVRNGDVMRPGDHGFLAAVLEPGMRAVTIAVDNTTGLAGLIWPGDRVDLILTQTIGETNLPIGHRVAAETVLQDARVIAIDQQIMQGAVAAPDSQAKTVTMEVTEEQAERISVATRLGRLSLSVRSADTTQRFARPTSGTNTTWAVDVSPALGSGPPAPPADNVVRVFQGGGDVKEFKYLMRTMIKLLCETCVAAVLIGAPLAVAVEPGAAVPVVASPTERGGVVLEAGTGKVLSLVGAATNIFVADPKVAEVRPASPSSLFVFGISAGHTTVAAMDSNGHLLAQYDLTVHPASYGATTAQAMIARLVPNAHVQVQAQAHGLMLTGSVSSPSEAAQAVSIAKGYAGDTTNIDNEIVITAPIQVTLNVRIAQMSRTVVRNLGINWSALGNIGNIAQITPAVGLATAGSLGAIPGLIGNQGAKGFTFSALIDALANDNLAHMLAEPNLTVMSGQTASFQVGGEYPIPVGQQNGTISIDFKSYGVLLSFLPTVMSDGRINIHVKPEVSELDKADGIQLSAGNSTILVPALTVRRAESTVELGSGESFAIAGLLQQTTQDNGNGLPGLGDTPVIGALFHDNQLSHQEQELVIIVTPYVVRPVNNVAALHLPTDGYKTPSDLERLFLMRQVTPSAAPVAVRIPGDAGFVVQ